MYQSMCDKKIVMGNIQIRTNGSEWNQVSSDLAPHSRLMGLTQKTVFIIYLIKFLRAESAWSSDREGVNITFPDIMNVENIYKEKEKSFYDPSIIVCIYVKTITTVFILKMRLCCLYLMKI